MESISMTVLRGSIQHVSVRIKELLEGVERGTAAVPSIAKSKGKFILFGQRR
jgi:hypothetical protein